MAEETVDTAIAEETDFEYPITVEDAGPSAKRVTVEIPETRIQEKLAEQFKDLRSQAALPGFRPGHAPQKLVERRFNKDVREQVRSVLVRESYEQALQRNNLQVLGEPEFEDIKTIESLPSSGPLKYSFSIEVQPSFDIPDLSDLRVKKVRINVTEEHVDQAMKNLREQQGELVPVEDRGVQEGDYLFGDVHLKLNGETIGHQHNSQLVARPGRIAGIQVDDIAVRLAGLKPGETRTFTVKVPDDHPNEKLRGQDIEIELKLNDIKQLKLAELTPEFLSDLGFEDEAGLRQALREQMVERIDSDVRQSMRQQVAAYLLERVQMELPSKLSEKQTQRVAQRRAMSLLQRGVPSDKILANIEVIKEGSDVEAVRELKLLFVLQKIAEERGIEVSESELNGQIAIIAIQSGKRPEKVKQELAANGQLAQLYIQLREQRTLDSLLEQAQIEEVDGPEQKKD
jgi:trigger factor